MSFIVLHANDAFTALAEDPVVPAAQVARFHDAAALLDAAADLHASARSAHADTAEVARREGFAAGHAEGLEAGKADVAAELFRLAARDAERTVARQAEVARLALQVVRRIAGEIGEPEMIAGIAQRAAAAIEPDAAATIRVAPAALEPTRARLAARTLVTVEADPSLSATDCVVETALGRTHAGLETQLAQIERIWATDGR